MWNLAKYNPIASIECTKCAFGLCVRVFLFTFSTFFFFLPAFVDFGRQYLLLWTVYVLFTHCAYTIYVLKNIKNGFHDTIYTFKNYFATVFSVFSNNKFNLNTLKTKQKKQRKDASIKADNRIKRQLKNVKTNNVLILGLQLISFT